MRDCKAPVWQLARDSRSWHGKGYHSGGKLRQGFLLRGWIRKPRLQLSYIWESCTGIPCSCKCGPWRFPWPPDNRWVCWPDQSADVEAIMPAITAIKQRSQERIRPVKHLFYLKPTVSLLGSGPCTSLAGTQTHLTHLQSCLLGSPKTQTNG